MGGIKNTITNQLNNTKKVLSGKGNLGDIGNILLGNDTFNKPQDWQAPPDPNDPFTFDAKGSAADQAAINALGQSQYDANLKGISDVSTADTQRAKDLFGQMLPDIAENSQAAHLYDSTGYGQEVARQQSSIASQIANQEAQQKLSALGGLQGFQTGALQRGMSLQDFTKQAQVAKAIGATVTPQAPSSKATGTQGGLAGAGTGATIGTSVSPGYGTLIGALLGGAAGYTGGSQYGSKGSK